MNDQSDRRQVLIAEDHALERRRLEALLATWGYRTTSVGDGEAAWTCIQSDPGLQLAIVDRGMPHLDGLGLCRRIRKARHSVYVLMLTAHDAIDEMVAGLDAGADDYLAKPADPQELRARMRVGVRTIGLERSLAKRVAELEEAAQHIKQLQGLLPICMHCKSIRDDRENWNHIEDYIAENTDVSFTHGLCERCLKTHYPAQYEESR